MSDRVAELEARVAVLSEALERLEGRVAAMERSRTPARRTAPPARPDAAAARAADRAELAALGGTVTFVGRTLLVLAGAFLLRALTDAGTLSAWAGVTAGLAYAGTWIAIADRAAAHGRRTSAGFHAAAAVVIGFPLLFEAASRFRLLSPAVAAALLAAFTAVALAVAARRRFEALAWLVALGGAATAVALMPFGGRLAPPILYLVALGVAPLWLGYVLDWIWLRWPIAIATNLAVLALVARAMNPRAAEGPGTLLAVELALLAPWLGSIAARTLYLRRPVVLFEVVQTAALLAVGLGGGALVAARSGTGEVALGVASVAMGAAAYAVSFAFVERQERAKANFVFYTSVAIVFVLAGAALALPGAALPIALGALAAAVAVLARRHGRRTLGAHAAAYGVAAVATSGLLGAAARATFSSAGGAFERAGPAALTTLALAAVAAGLGSEARGTFRERVPRLALVAAIAVASEGVLLGWLAPLAARGPAADPGAVATLRTAVLVGGTFALAFLGRSEGWCEARWLVYPLLALTGLKLLVEDVSRSRPATLFVAFAAYGAALLVVPRLRRATPSPPPAATSPAPDPGPPASSSARTASRS